MKKTLMELTSLATIVAYDALRSFDDAEGIPTKHPKWEQLTEEQRRFFLNITNIVSMSTSEDQAYGNMLRAYFNYGWKYDDRYSLHSKTSPFLLPAIQASAIAKARFILLVGVVASVFTGEDDVWIERDKPEVPQGAPFDEDLDKKIIAMEEDLDAAVAQVEAMNGGPVNPVEVTPGLSDEEVTEMFHVELEGRLPDEEEDGHIEDLNETASDLTSETGLAGSTVPPQEKEIPNAEVGQEIPKKAKAKPKAKSAAAPPKTTKPKKG